MPQATQTSGVTGDTTRDGVPVAAGDAVRGRCATGTPLSGGCLCGALRYRLGPPRCASTLCHCESCRRASGAHSVGWVTVRPQDVEWLTGTPREFGSSPGVWRGFCATCGTPLTYRSERRPEEFDVTLASLDDPGAMPPADHIWMADAVAWDRPADGLPQFPAGRPAP